jgi:hypothetical protein
VLLDGSDGALVKDLHFFLLLDLGGVMLVFNAPRVALRSCLESVPAVAVVVVEDDMFVANDPFPPPPTELTDDKDDRVVCLGLRCIGIPLQLFGFSPSKSFFFGSRPPPALALATPGPGDRGGAPPNEALRFGGLGASSPGKEYCLEGCIGSCCCCCCCCCCCGGCSFDFVAERSGGDFESNSDDASTATSIMVVDASVVRCFRCRCDDTWNTAGQLTGFLHSSGSSSI